MPPQRRWKIHQQQLALLEYSDLSAHCPPGVYVTYHPSQPGQWSGVYFVRKGSYATAPLRFKLIFPKQYPESPPALIFSNDIFHPLVCPLTTYTYSTASPARQPVSSADDKRLSPGSLNLQHHFPIWFDNGDTRNTSSRLPSSPKSVTARGHDDPAFSDDEFDHMASTDTPTPVARLSSLPFMPPPKADALEWSSPERYPSIAEVLRYMVRVFEDDELLDEVPLDAAANSSAHHAWTAYRKRVKEAEAAREAAKSRAVGGAPMTPQSKFARSQVATASPGRSPAQWNWDGVWMDRVRKSVRNATAEGKLFKDDEADEHQLITFLDREKEELMLIKAEALKIGQSIASPISRKTA